MLALIDTCQALPESRGRLCACLGSDALGRLRPLASDLRLGPGERVYRAGDPSGDLFGLRQGMVMLSRHLPDGRRQVLSFLCPGDIFGFSSGPHRAEALTLQRVGLCRIPAAAVAGDRALSARLLKIAQDNLADALDLAVRLGRMTARERVTAFLADLWRRQGTPQDLVLPMRMVEIGDHLGLRAETVCRCFRNLRDDGLIGSLSQDGMLSVLDGDGLQALVP